MVKIFTSGKNNAQVDVDRVVLMVYNHPDYTERRFIGITPEGAIYPFRYYDQSKEVRQRIPHEDQLTNLSSVYSDPWLQVQRSTEFKVEPIKENHEQMPHDEQENV